jgi:hypothetical protein
MGVRKKASCITLATIGPNVAEPRADHAEQQGGRAGIDADQDEARDRQQRLRPRQVPVSARNTTPIRGRLCAATIAVAHHAAQNACTV